MIQDIHLLIFSYLISVPIKLLDWVDKNKIDWTRLSLNSAAIDLIRENPDKINWVSLSANNAAIDLLRENIDKINWEKLSENPAIFEPDYKTHRELCLRFLETYMNL